MPQGRVKLPTYQSLQECQHRTGIPIVLLRAEKRSGNRGFIGSRVQLEEFLRDLFDESRKPKEKKKSGSIEDETLDKNREQSMAIKTKRLLDEILIREKNDELVDGERLKEEIWSEQIAPLKSALERMPQQVAPLANPTQPEIAKAALSRWWEDAKKDFREPTKKGKK
jgi:hypothetical protein